METPGASNVQGAPGVNAEASNPPPAALKNPRGDSRMLFAAVKPRCAIDAASSPLSAARPAWNGLVMVPKFSRRPAACDAAMLSATRVTSALSPSIQAAAAPDPMVPTVPVEWNPSS